MPVCTSQVSVPAGFGAVVRQRKSIELFQTEHGSERPVPAGRSSGGRPCHGMSFPQRSSCRPPERRIEFVSVITRGQVDQGSGFSHRRIGHKLLQPKDRPGRRDAFRQTGLRAAGVCTRGRGGFCPDSEGGDQILSPRRGRPSRFRSGFRALLCGIAARAIAGACGRPGAIKVRRNRLPRSYNALIPVCLQV